ncbi:hypothetical protein G3M48_000924 [Beauveria asiatica]|uniref:Uncharacterized protein n=1 Tax=Beauveria asiatica TaxID=1069075 RepID=A0AAW0RFW3_9HYPO
MDTIMWAEAISVLYTWQIILVVFTEAGGLDAQSLANETLDRLTNRTQCLPTIMKFHCSVGSIPIENGAIRADSLCLSQEVVEIIRDWNRWEWPKADKVVLREALIYLRRAIHETARHHEVPVKTWYLSDEEECWELYVFIRDLSISEECDGAASSSQTRRSRRAAVVASDRDSSLFIFVSLHYTSTIFYTLIMARQNHPYHDSFYSSMLPYDAGLHYVRHIGIFPPQHINALPSSAEALAGTISMDNTSSLMTSKIRQLGLLLTETIFDDIQNALRIVDDTENLLRDVQGVEMLDRNVYIALQSLEAMALQRTGSLLFEKALEELGHHIRKERLAERAYDKCSQNIVWNYWKLQFEGDDSPFLRHDWGRIIVELQCLKIPDETEAPWAYQSAKYLQSFCELYTAQDPPSVKVHMLFLRPRPRGDYELLKDLFIKLSFSMVYIDKLSVDEKKKLFKQYGEYLRFCQDATPKSRLRGLRR